MSPQHECCKPLGFYQPGTSGVVGWSYSVYLSVSRYIIVGVAFSCYVHVSIF